MAKMHVIDLLQVTGNKNVEKRFPQVGGGGGRMDFGEGTANTDHKRDLGLRLRA